MLAALVGEQLRAELVAAGGRLPEERRLVSAIFADLSGFTPLAGRLDPETMAEVVDPILAALVRIVKRGEGYVGSFAGDALLAYFGAPVAHEDDAVRAVRCAQEMLAEFPALLAVAPPEAAELSLRIGVDTGAVMARLVAGDIKTDYNILGNSVNMAQRLQSNAPPGGCVVGETTYRLAKDSFDFEDLGGLTVEGRAEPLPAWLLVGERQRSMQRRDARTATIVGRDVELAALSAAEQAGGGLLLMAEAGAGKSRLLEEAQTRSSRTWLGGGCAPHDTSRSYRPWASVLAGIAAEDDGLRIVAGDLDPRLAALPPARRRDVVATDVASALRAAAPAVVVLEDLHWADQPSLDLFDDLL
ncbi:MAG: adenylate/guanylate cyclase domain-containing protein, partial [Nocardioides sp.]